MARLINYPNYFLQPIYRVEDLGQSYYQSLSDLRLIQLMTEEDWAHLQEAVSNRISSNRLKRLMAYRLNAFAPPKLKEFPKEDPLGALDTIRRRLTYSRGPTLLQPRDGYFISPDGQAVLLLAYPVLSPEDGK